jgi:hypothetical protein
MAKKSPKAAKQDAGRKGARMRVRVVLLELKGIMPYLTAPSLDEDTRQDIERTLLNCRDRLDSVAKAFRPTPKVSDENSASAEPAHA